MSSGPQEFAGYQIIRTLGSGGTGEVFLARHPRLPREVALKVLRPEFSRNDEFRSRFLREADLVSQLSHPSIIDVTDRGEEDRRLWLAMRYIPGADAGQLLQDGPLDVDKTAQIISTIADALDFAHSRGVLHRDVKPANILVPEFQGAGPAAFITDFGVGMRVDDERLTRMGTMVGTVDYTAPERFTNDTTDALADQYSLACTAFHLLTGSRPFGPDSLANIVAAHRSRQPPAASSLNPQLNWPVDHVLYRALSKRPEDRYASCADFAADLAAFLDPTTPFDAGVSDEVASLDTCTIALQPPSGPSSPWVGRTRVEPEGLDISPNDEPAESSSNRPDVTLNWEVWVGLTLVIILVALLIALTVVAT